MEINLENVQFPSEYIDLIRKYYPEVGPHLQYLVAGLPDKDASRVVLNLTVKNQRNLMAKLGKDLIKCLNYNTRHSETGFTTREIGHDACDKIKFINFQEWMKQVFLSLSSTYPHEEVWHAYLNLIDSEATPPSE